MSLNLLIDALHPFGDVLEVGFGPSSEKIQTYHPKSHIIIECDKDSAERARKWAEKYPSVQIIEDIWQGALPRLGVFDTIYFGIDPPEELISGLTKIRYADFDLDQFCKTVIDAKALARFLQELERDGQISEEQKEKMFKKYRLISCPLPKRKSSGQFFQFLKQCLSFHMRKGSRFSCYLKDEVDDPDFFNEIIVHPHLDYRLINPKTFVIEKLS